MKLKRRVRAAPPSFTVFNDAGVTVGYITQQLGSRKWQFYMHAGVCMTVDELHKLLELIKEQLG